MRNVFFLQKYVEFSGSGRVWIFRSSPFLSVINFVLFWSQNSTNWKCQFGRLARYAERRLCVTAQDNTHAMFDLTFDVTANVMAILVLRSNEGVNPSYAGKVLRTERVGAAAEKTSVGTKMPRTSWKHLRDTLDARHAYRLSTHQAPVVACLQ